MDDEELGRIFMPYFDREFNRIKNNSGLDFIYYTNLTTIHSILRNKEIWLRNVSCMNDFQEVHQGYTLVRTYLFKNQGNNFQRLINLLLTIKPTVKWKEIVNDLVSNSEPYFLYNTYIACLSEHSVSDDQYGKLSMWRAYGRGNGGAIVINKNKIVGNQIIIPGVMLSRVAYLSENGFNDEFDSVLNNIEQNISVLKLEDDNRITQLIVGAIIAAILSIKHPGFVEEKEWRIIFVDNPNNKGSQLKKEVECINGIPQNVYKLKLDTLLPQLVRKVIIGPTQYSGVSQAVLLDDLRILLRKDNVLNYLSVSNIPIRPECI